MSLRFKFRRRNGLTLTSMPTEHGKQGPGPPRSAVAKPASGLRASSFFSGWGPLRARLFREFPSRTGLRGGLAAGEQPRSGRRRGGGRSGRGSGGAGSGEPPESPRPRTRGAARARPRLRPQPPPPARRPSSWASSPGRRATYPPRRDLRSGLVTAYGREEVGTANQRRGAGGGPTSSTSALMRQPRSSH